MKNLTTLLFTFFIVTTFSQTTHTINAGSYYYNPTQLTIDVGDSVVWINDGGFHDVNGNINTVNGQPFNNPETLDVATVTKLIRNTFLVILIPLFAFLYNRGEFKEQKYSILSIFPYFVIGFIGMIVLRNLGDQFFSVETDNFYVWSKFIEYIKLY